LRAPHPTRSGVTRACVATPRGPCVDKPRASPTALDRARLRRSRTSSAWYAPSTRCCPLTTASTPPSCCGARWRPYARRVRFCACACRPPRAPPLA
jgi:hypothetical protein